MTTAEVITEIRNQISDTNAAYRYDDTDMYPKLAAAQVQIVADHPEALCSDTVVSTSITDPIAAAVEPQINDMFFLALVHMTCHLIFMDDSEDVGNAKLADKHLVLYERSMS